MLSLKLASMYVIDRCCVCQYSLLSNLYEISYIALPQCFLIQHWDEDVHGSMDTNANRCTNPQGFTWTCCGENGATSRGCCDNRGSTLEELYPIEISDDESSHGKDGGNDDDQDDREEVGRIEDEREMHHNGELVIDLQSNLWTVTCTKN